MKHPVLVVIFHPEGEGCLSFSTCSFAILNGFLRDHGKIIDAPSLVDLKFCRGDLSQKRTHASTRLLVLIRPGGTRYIKKAGMLVENFEIEP